jgi:hypothetical protein
VAFTIDVIAARGLEHTIRRHHRHQRVDVMAIPGIGERRQQLFQFPVRVRHD